MLIKTDTNITKALNSFPSDDDLTVYAKEKEREDEINRIAKRLNRKTWIGAALVSGALIGAMALYTISNWVSAKKVVEKIRQNTIDRIKEAEDKYRQGFKTTDPIYASLQKDNTNLRASYDEEKKSHEHQLDELTTKHEEELARKEEEIRTYLNLKGKAAEALNKARGDFLSLQKEYLQLSEKSRKDRSELKQTKQLLSEKSRKLEQKAEELTKEKNSYLQLLREFRKDRAELLAYRTKNSNKQEGPVLYNGKFFEVNSEQRDYSRFTNWTHGRLYFNHGRFNRYPLPSELFGILMDKLEGKLSEKEQPLIQSIYSSPAEWLELGINYKGQVIKIYEEPGLFFTGPEKSDLVLKRKFNVGSLPRGKWIDLSKFPDDFVVYLYGRKFKNFPEKMRESDPKIMLPPDSTRIYPMLKYHNNITGSIYTNKSVSRGVLDLRKHAPVEFFGKISVEALTKRNNDGNKVLMSFEDSLERLQKESYARHIRPKELFSLMAYFYKGVLSYDAQRAAIDVINNHSGKGNEWLDVAIKREGDTLIVLENLKRSDEKVRYSKRFEFNIRRYPSGRVSFENLPDNITDYFFGLKYKELPGDIKKSKPYLEIPEESELSFASWTGGRSFSIITSAKLAASRGVSSLEKQLTGLDIAVPKDAYQDPEWNIENHVPREKNWFHGRKAFTYEDSLIALEKRGYERHLHPREAFDFIAAYYKGELRPEFRPVLNDMLSRGGKEWLNIAVEAQGDEIYVYENPKNLHFDSDKNTFVMSEYGRIHKFNHQSSKKIILFDEKFNHWSSKKIILFDDMPERLRNYLYPSGIKDAPQKILKQVGLELPEDGKLWPAARVGLSIKCSGLEYASRGIVEGSSGLNEIILIKN